MENALCLRLTFHVAAARKHAPHLPPQGGPDGRPHQACGREDPAGQSAVRAWLYWAGSVYVATTTAGASGSGDRGAHPAWVPAQEWLSS